MSNETSRIASTPLLGLVPLGSPGDRGHGRLFDALMARFGERHAALLADPEPVADGSAVDWYVPGYVRAVRFTDLPAEQAQKVERELTAIANDVRGFAQELDQSKRGGPDRSLAEALRNAMQIPGPEYLYAVGDQPVLVAWAYHKQEASPFGVGLVRIADVDPLPAPSLRPPPPLASAARRSISPGLPPAEFPGPQPGLVTVPRAIVAARRPFPRFWLLWLLFAILVAAIFALLLRACAINVVHTWFPGLPWCGYAPSIVHDDLNRISDLQSLISNLQQQLDRRAAACPAGQLTLPPLQPQRPPDAAEIDKRVTQEGGEKGELQISLGWSGEADLDLHVRCPDGLRINFSERSNCGGRLQIDMNAEKHSTEPVEDVVFPSIDTITPGVLKVGVAWYADRGDTRTMIPATIVIKRRGQIIAEKRVDVQRPPQPPGIPNFFLEIPVPR